MQTYDKVLDKEFKHHCWWKNSGLTRRQVIEWAAVSPEITKDGTYLEKKTSYRTYEDYYVLVSEEGGTYRLTKTEYEYYVQRRLFWRNWKATMKAKGYDDTTICKKAGEIPEYASFLKTMRASFEKDRKDR